VVDSCEQENSKGKKKEELGKGLLRPSRQS